MACPAVHLLWTEDKKLFLLNRTEQEQRVTGELFGFKTGKFEKKVKGQMFCYVSDGQLGIVC